MSDGKKPLVYRINDRGQGPELLHQVFLERGWLEFDEDTQHDSDWNIWWRTSRFRVSDYENIFPWQRLNHYPKSTGITKKDCLVRNLRRMKGVHGAGVYNFSPLSFNLPNDYTRYVAEYGKLKAKIDEKTFTWICKPADMSRGRGIFLFKDISELQYDCNAVVQQYVANPLLIGGYKCDIRIYVAVPSFHPLTIYIFEEGIVRFSTEKYDLSMINNVFSHLTNTSINIHSPFYNKDKERIGLGCKWTITQLRHYFHQNNLDDRLLWVKITNIIILTMLIQAPQVPKEKNCYELYGFDILIDENLKPWLLEVNFSPALSTDCQVDILVKKPLLHDLMDMMNFKDSDADRGGLDKHSPRKCPTARGRMSSATGNKTSRGDTIDRTTSSSRLSQRGGIQRMSSTISSMNKSIEPPKLESTLSFIQQDNPSIQKKEEKLCFGLPLVHPSDDEKGDSDCHSGRSSPTKSDGENEDHDTRKFGALTPLPTSLTIASYDRSGTMSSIVKKADSVPVSNQRGDKTSLKSFSNSDSAYSSFSDNSERVVPQSESENKTKTVINRRKSYTGFQSQVLSEAPTEAKQSIQIKSLRPSENSRSLRKISNRIVTPVSHHTTLKLLDRGVSKSYDRAPSRAFNRRSISRFGNATTRSDTDFSQRNQDRMVVSSLSNFSKTVKESNNKLINLGLSGTSKKASLNHKGRQRTKSISVQGHRPKGPPPQVGNFFLVFPFNETTVKAANTTLDPHFVIKEAQKLVKELKMELDKNPSSKKLGGHLPYGAAHNASRLWAPLKLTEDG